MVAQSLATAPACRDDKPEAKPASFSALPFVYRPKRGRKNASNWRVPPTDDYALACERGREYAAHFVQFMKDNPSWVGSGTLGTIVADIDFTDESGAKGYWVGFVAQLERLLVATTHRIDVFAHLDKINAFYADLAAKRDHEDAPTS